MMLRGGVHANFDRHYCPDYQFVTMWAGSGEILFKQMTSLKKNNFSLV
jgi:hypothetical protein